MQNFISKSVSPCESLTGLPTRPVSGSDDVCLRWALMAMRRPAYCL